MILPNRNLDVLERAFDNIEHGFESESPALPYDFFVAFYGNANTLIAVAFFLHMTSCPHVL